MHRVAMPRDFSQRRRGGGGPESTRSGRIVGLVTATRVYTDGACLGNPGPGGWAYVVDEGPWAAGSEPHTTNQRMEITASWRGVAAMDGPVEIMSDSIYVVNCFRNGWWEGWLARDWRNSQRKPVANRDLWEPFIDLVRSRGDVSFRWVKAHSGDRLNDAADVLAVEAARTQQGRAGDRFDAGVLASSGLGDVAGSASAAAGGATGTAGGDRTGHGVVVTGHRPPELGGYDDNPVADRVRDTLVQILTAKRQLQPDLVVLTGLGLGAEQLGAEAAMRAGVPYVAVLPFPDADAVWPAASRARYRDLLAGASGQVLLSDEVPASRAEAGKALGRRDDWLARNGVEAILVWDREDSSLARSFARLERAFGDDVWVVEPEP
jgi:ribonuclease HI